MKQLSVVIVNYNVRYFLELCIRSVQAAIETIDAEIIVVDNDSRDDSCTMVRELFPEVILIANEKNVGFSTANNQGVEKAQGTYVCILNPDTVVSEDTFEKLLNFASQKPQIGAVGARLVDGTGRFLPESKRNLPTPKVAFQKIFGNGASYYVNTLGQYETGKITVLAGAFMFLKHTVYTEVKGFDEQYFMYGEDIDLSYTIEETGYLNYYFGETTVLHYKGESTAKDATYRKRFYDAMRIFYYKHFNSNSIEAIVVRMGLWLATLSRKRISETPKEKSTVLPKMYMIVTDNEQLVSLISKSIGASIKKVTDLKDAIAGTEVFLDAASISYTRCITLISESANKQLTFKIIPKNTTFAIGSNSSEGRGEVLHF
ncbi:glycosyltransferase family 2 protein [uncultured Dokdonia sp.]|uniref:glycosyltransferase family 2 protein n=1 Tax=uncultured Dokdonia sp. TaxID=575653 RepID=UPI002612B7D7|nr:glycosyltransferase family 2 protein [uncultured Dokdonia sp.]